MERMCFPLQWSVWSAALVASAAYVLGQAAVVDDPRVALTAPDTNGWVHVKSSVASADTVFTVRASTNLQTWTPIAAIHGGPVDFADPATRELVRRFYLVSRAPRTGADDWKNQIVLPDDPFVSRDNQQEVRWIKFIIPATEPNRVYFQDSTAYPFHYDFAASRLPQFKGMSRPAFDAVTLRVTNQQAVLGAVLLPSIESGRSEYGIQFVGMDAYPRESMARWFNLVRSAVAPAAQTQAFYMPTYEQAGPALADEPWLRAQGVLIASADRWTTGNICYAMGWALGRLAFVPAAEINAAYADGRLHPDDILLTDAVPAEIPFVAGVVTTRPSTPNSHVAILARSHGLPFVYLADLADRERVQSLIGTDVLLRVSGPAEGCETRLFGLSSGLDPALRSDILTLKTPPQLALTPKASFGSLTAPVDGLEPSDIRFFGGKAANFGALRRKIPDNSPVAIAFSFDLWDAFLNQKLPEGRTLAAEITNRLARHTYPPDVAALRADLKTVRDLITGTAGFTVEQEQSILNAVSIFPRNTKIRFRSSTNVEDSEHYSGAGLYDSFSGCPADDLDSDTAGPSACDPDEPNERGVFRAIKKVYASFYNENAFLERLRLGVDEGQVGMAVLAHVSTPDEIELANGVATLRLTPSGAQGEFVTQAGAVSVTNPDSSAQPEVVAVSRFSFGAFFDAQQRSALVPLGGYVMTWETDYRALLNLLLAVADEYRARGASNAVLDFEYKKIAPGALSVKQVRQVPSADSGTPSAAYLLNEPGDYCVFQGEFGDVFANHRLKSHWALASRNLRLAATNLASGIYTNVTVELLDGAQRIVLTNGTANWPGAGHVVDGSALLDRWKLGEGAATRVFTLETLLSTDLSAGSTPIVALGDLQPMLGVQYSTPRLSLDFDGMPALVTNETARLWPCPVVTSGSLLQERALKAAGVSIRTSFYWPEPPRGVVAGYTAPLQAWVETQVIGLTTEPIVLRGDYSQTYRPEHHNFAESFLFEPQLETGLAEAQLRELEAANIRLVHVYYSGGVTRVTLVGLDGKFRAFP